MSRKNYKLTFTVFMYSGHQEWLEFYVKASTNGFLVPHFNIKRGKAPIHISLHLLIPHARAPHPADGSPKDRRQTFSTASGLGRGQDPAVAQISSLKTSSTAPYTGGFYSERETQPTCNQCNHNVTRERCRPGGKTSSSLGVSAFFFLCPVTWTSIKQPVVTLSTPPE